MSNGTKAIITSVLSTTTWAEAGIITVGWTAVFGIISAFGLLAGADLASVARYFVGSMSCGVASAVIVSVIHGAIVGYREIVAYEKMAARRRRVRRARRMTA